MSLLPALGIDYGEARIGVAATDPLGILAHPVETISCTQGDPIARLVELTKQRGIQTLVLGFPYRIDGREGTATQKVRAFAQRLTEALPHTPLHLVDERLSTCVAHQKMQESGRKAKNRKHVIDQAAAVEILSSWMQEQHLLSSDLTPPWEKDSPAY